MRGAAFVGLKDYASEPRDKSQICRKARHSAETRKPRTGSRECSITGPACAEPQRPSADGFLAANQPFEKAISERLNP
jgi:hypothetical protein